MSIAIITGAGGLVGAQSVSHFSSKFDKVIGIDNDMRSYFFGKKSSTSWNIERLKTKHSNFENYNLDIRSQEKLDSLFSQFKSEIKLIVHAAAQPSHDWAASEPATDFSVNATGTLNLLEATRKHSAQAAFVFCSTNKVYGDNPNALPFVETETRWEVDKSHAYFKNGVDEKMSIDSTTHSIFGASKASADLLVQEYGNYFNMNTVSFRGGCLTGPGHSGAELHGFLSYLMQCAITGKPYTIFGYKGKQVRDNIHCHDLVTMFEEFWKAPSQGTVFNCGGSRHSNCSMIEAIALCEDISGRKMNVSYSEENRIGDHIWYVSDVTKFKKAYPNWEFKYDLIDTLTEIHEELLTRLAK